MSMNSNWAELMVAAQKGNSKMYNVLLTEVSQYLQSYLSYKLHAKERVPDLLQEILISIHNSRHTFDGTLPFKPWLFKIVQSRLIDFYRKNGRQKEVYGHEDENFMENISTEAEISNLEISDFQKALNSLTDDQRKILCAIKLEGKSIKEVSLEFSLSESAVKVAAHRAYKQLSQHLGVTI
jgi:RNA polymerase sigma-70 factor, ECF subfamily